MSVHSAARAAHDVDLMGNLTITVNVCVYHYIPSLDGRRRAHTTHTYRFSASLPVAWQKFVTQAWTSVEFGSFMYSPSSKDTLKGVLSMSRARASRSRCKRRISRCFSRLLLADSRFRFRLVWLQRHVECGLASSVVTAILQAPVAPMSAKWWEVFLVGDIVEVLPALVDAMVSFLGPWWKCVTCPFHWPSSYDPFSHRLPFKGDVVSHTILIPLSCLRPCPHHITNQTLRVCRQPPCD